jgi:PAS domain S-box-containing protein
MLNLPDHRLHLRENLLQISRAITSQLDLTSVLNLVIKVSVEMLAGTAGFIALYEENEGAETDQLQIQASAQLPTDVWPLLNPLLDLPLIDAPREVEERVLREVAANTGLLLRQVVALPLIFRANPVGVIYVFRAALNVAFSSDDVRVLQAFADQAAIAVSNARLYQGVLSEKQRLDAIIEQSADGVMILDNRWRIVTFNRAMENLTGWSRSEAIGRPCAEVLDLRSPQGEPVCPNQCPLQQMAFDHESAIVEGRITHRDGREFYIQSRYAPQIGPANAFKGAIANVRDITEQKREEELQSTFVSIISHELKTPVSIIKGFAGTLRRDDATWSAETIRDGLGVIEEEADRLARQIQDLLDVSRLQTGWIHLEPTDWSLKMLAEEVIRNLALQHDDRFVFELRFPEDLPPVRADYERIRMVLTNLISNAIKYSPEGGTIRIGGYGRDEKAIVFVSDEGVGIPPEEQDRIFERFYRVDNRLRRETQGTGLGLFLSQAILKAHGEKIWVRSQVGRGSRFFFTLPLSHRQITAGEREKTGEREQGIRG